ncbi:hypothetical protein [Microcoleus vaginatus]|uniref:hypothetical protein n=1 Tax=Microcoleus vaginatus TaxID=119532 RepID=UPI001F611071
MPWAIATAGFSLVGSYDAIATTFVNLFLSWTRHQSQQIQLNINLENRSRRD